MKTTKIITALSILGCLLAVGTAGASKPIPLGPPVVVDGSSEPQTLPVGTDTSTTPLTKNGTTENGTTNEPADEPQTVATAEATTTTPGAAGTPAAVTEPAEQQAEDVAVRIEEPRPILLHQDGSMAAADRDPFAIPPSRRVFDAEYGKVVDNIDLQGIIRVGERQMGLFAVGASTGGRGSARDQGQLRRVEVGEPLRFFIDNTEFLFTVAQLEERAAVLIGENNAHYKVWL